MVALSRDLSKADFESFAAQAYDLAGIELNESKRHLVISRLIRRVRALKLENLNDYRTYLKDNFEDEKDNFINAITTNLTYFFRESHHFDSLRDHLAQTGNVAPRIWSAGCSTGQEPYSIAMTLAQSNLTRGSILASDIDTQVLEKATNGVYRINDIQGLDDGMMKRFFLSGSGSNAGLAKVKEELQNYIEFRQVNLMEALPNEQFDAIFCRNVFIYFDMDTQMKLVQEFASRLAPGGLLFLGHSELLKPPEHLFSVAGKTTFLKCHA